MTGIFKAELDRAFINTRFLIVLVLAGACFAWGYRDAAGWFRSAENNAFDVWLFLHYRSHYQWLAPIAAALPFVDSLLIDRSQGFLRSVLVRARYRHYVSAKAIANLLAGAAAVAGPLLAAYLVANLVYPRSLPDPSAFFKIWGTELGQPRGLLAGLYAQQPDLYILALVALAACFGAIYASFGLAVSAVIPNRYVALASPFLLYMAADFVSVRARRLGPLWSPERSLIPYVDDQVTFLVILAQFALLIAFSALLLALFARRARLSA